MSERKPLRHDATRRMIRDWKSERKSCSDLEVAYTNAGAQVYIAEQNLRRAEADRDRLTQEKGQNEKELALLNKEIDKEKKQGRSATNRGAAIFGPIGGIIGAPAGPGGAMYFGARGIGVGSFIGYSFEELGDAINPNTRTDLTLDVLQKNLMKDNHEIEEKLRSVVEKLERVLRPEYESRRKEEGNIRNRLLKCRQESG